MQFAHFVWDLIVVVALSESRLVQAGVRSITKRCTDYDESRLTFHHKEKETPRYQCKEKEEQYTTCFISHLTCSEKKAHERGEKVPLGVTGEGCGPGCDCAIGYIKTVFSPEPGYCISFDECTKRDDEERKNATKKADKSPKDSKKEEGKHECVENEYWGDCFDDPLTCDILIENLLKGTTHSDGNACGKSGCHCKSGYVKSKSTDKPGFCIKRSECISKNLEQKKDKKEDKKSPKGIASSVATTSDARSGGAVSMNL